jgi:transaldolase
MEIFLDSACLKEIERAVHWGLIDGVTTNPSLIEKTGGNFHVVIKEICSMVTGSVSAEVLSNSYEDMVEEGLVLSAIAPQVTVKVPLSLDGIRACAALRKKKVPVNVTLCFSGAQAILAAKAGATYLSPFLGRLDDIGSSGDRCLEDIIDIVRQYPHWDMKVLAASIRSVQHVVTAARLGVDVVTIPWKILQEMFHHPLSQSGLAIFNASAKNILNAKAS